MSTEKQDKYKELYSKYIERSVDLHNLNCQFEKSKGYRISREIRSTLKDLITIQKMLIAASRYAYKEALENYKVRQKYLKEQAKREKKIYRYKKKITTK
jgi:hypothetical protein